MKRTILTPPVLPAAAVDELKAWLAITDMSEDDALEGLLRASIDLCEAFTGRLPLACLCEEVHTLQTGWQAILAEPVRSIEAAEIVAEDGTRMALEPGDYRAEITASAAGRFRILRGGAEGLAALRFTAGIAESWETLPASLRHGIIRCAAHFYHVRDHGEDEARLAAIAALWRGWRRMRLA